MSDGSRRAKTIRAVFEIIAIPATILSFFGLTLFPQRVLFDLINFGKISPNEAVLLVTIIFGLARVPFSLAYLFADSKFVQRLRLRYLGSLRDARLALLAILPSPDVVNSLFIAALVSFAFFLGTLIHWTGQPDNTYPLFADRWPPQTQALPNYDLAQLQKWREADPAVIPVVYERPSDSMPAAQLFADAKLGSKQDMASLKQSIKDLLGERELFVRSVELKDRKQSKRFYRMLAGPFQSRADVVKFCAAYNRRFNLHGRAACLPESVSLEIRTTDNETCYRRSSPRPLGERPPESRTPDLIFPRLFDFDKFI
jgi:hypothetical protein